MIILIYAALLGPYEWVVGPRGTIALSLVPKYLILYPPRVRGVSKWLWENKGPLFSGPGPGVDRLGWPKILEKCPFLFWSWIENMGLSWKVTLWLLGCQGLIQKLNSVLPWCDSWNWNGFYFTQIYTELGKNTPSYNDIKMVKFVIRMRLKLADKYWKYKKN